METFAVVSAQYQMPAAAGKWTGGELKDEKGFGDTQYHGSEGHRSKAFCALFCGHHGELLDTEAGCWDAGVGHSLDSWLKPQNGIHFPY